MGKEAVSKGKTADEKIKELEQSHQALVKQFCELFVRVLAIQGFLQHGLFSKAELEAKISAINEFFQSSINTHVSGYEGKEQTQRLAMLLKLLESYVRTETVGLVFFILQGKEKWKWAHVPSAGI